jgi:predicted MPP superfamily phosphohydrolase
MHFPFKEITLYPGNFADALKGLRIVQLSDLLIGKKTDPAYLHQLVVQINRLHPDLVVFTGDIIKTFAFKLRVQLAVFKELEASAYYVSGNHDLFYGLNTLKRELALCNISCIDNKCAHLIINDTPLQILGLADRFSKIKAHKRPITELFSALNEEVSTIMLAHQPKDVEFIQGHRVDVMLSGHTHNADAYPFHAFLKKHQPYYKGLYVKGKTLLYVTSGLQSSVFQLKRKSLAEIPVFTIN